MMVDRRAAMAAGATLPLSGSSAAAAAVPAAPPALSAEPWLRVEVQVAPPLLFGRSEGAERRCVPLLGGTVSGRVTGTVLPGGTDWQRVRPDGTTELEAHYAIRTDRGEMIEARASGIRSGPDAAMKALLAGETVDPALIYFRVAYRFVTDAAGLRELATRLFVGVGRRDPARVQIDIHAVL